MFCVVDCRFNLGTIPDNAGVIHETRNVSCGECGNALRIECGKTFFEIVSFVKDGSPRETGLEGFQDKEFKNGSIVMHRNAPLRIVVGEHELVIVGGPGTAGYGFHGQQYSRRATIFPL